MTYDELIKTYPVETQQAIDNLKKSNCPFKDTKIKNLGFCFEVTHNDVMTSNFIQILNGKTKTKKADKYNEIDACEVIIVCRPKHVRGAKEGLSELLKIVPFEVFKTFKLGGHTEYKKYLKLRNFV